MFEEAVEALKSRDPVLAGVMERVGPCSIDLKREPFQALALSILYQQLATKAADTIVGRFRGLFAGREFPTPAEVLGTSDEKLRSAGVSRQKAGYLKDLALKFSEGLITPEKFPDMTDEQIIDQLTLVKGVGRWTAEMFLIFSLARPDVLPVGDLGFQRGVQLCYGLDEPPSADEMRGIARKWEPYRTVATWYMWRSLESVPVQEGTGHRPEK